jgi:ammonia channel protein AmtB
LRLDRTVEMLGMVISPLWTVVVYCCIYKWIYKWNNVVYIMLYI